MPLSFPSLAQIVGEIRGDIAGRLSGADTQTPRSPIDVIARILAYVHHSLHGWLTWLAKQMFPGTCEDESAERLGDWWGVWPVAATNASGRVVVTGAPGSVLKVDWALRRADGAQYVVDVETAIGSMGTAEVPIIAVEAGVGGNAAAGTPITLVSPIAGVQSQTVVAAAGLVGGADEERFDSLRDRIRSRVQTPPHGGNEKDYERWAREYPGVTRAWAFPRENGAGTVVVRFMMDDVYSDGLPMEADRQALQAYIEQFRPATAAVTVGVPVPVARAYTIAVYPDTPTIRVAVEAELRDLIRRDGAPLGTLRISREREAISTAVGEYDHTLVSPTADQTYTSTEVPTFGGITWVGS